MYEVVNFNVEYDNTPLCIVLIILFLTWCLYAVISIQFNKSRISKLNDIQNMIESGHARKVNAETEKKIKDSKK